MYGFSPVCVRTCSFRFSNRENDRLQPGMSHLYGFSPVWQRRWVISLYLASNGFKFRWHPFQRQTYLTIASVWPRSKWETRLWRFGNSFPQLSHKQTWGSSSSAVSSSFAGVAKLCCSRTAGRLSGLRGAMIMFDWNSDCGGLEIEVVGEIPIVNDSVLPWWLAAEEGASGLVGRLELPSCYGGEQSRG